MKRETHEYLRANRSPDHVPGEFVDSLEVLERAYEEGRQRFQEKYGTTP